MDLSSWPAAFERFSADTSARLICFDFRLQDVLPILSEMKKSCEAQQQSTSVVAASRGKTKASNGRVKSVVWKFKTAQKID